MNKMNVQATIESIPLSLVSVEKRFRKFVEAAHHVVTTGCWHYRVLANRNPSRVQMLHLNEKLFYVVVKRVLIGCCRRRLTTLP